MTDSDLLNAINADPTAKSLANAGNDAGCAARLSAILPPVVIPLSTASLLTWSASRGVRLAIHIGTTNTNAGIASACLAIEDAIQGGSSTLDLTNPVIAGSGGLIDALTQAGILPTNTAASGSPPTPGCKADLLAYASVPQIIDAGQVSHVYLVNRPGGIV